MHDVDSNATWCTYRKSMISRLRDTICVQVHPGWVQALPASLWPSQTGPCRPYLVSLLFRLSSTGGPGTLGSPRAQQSGPHTASRSPARHAALAMWRTLRTQGSPSLSCAARQNRGQQSFQARRWKRACRMHIAHAAWLHLALLALQRRWTGHSAEHLSPQQAPSVEAPLCQERCLGGTARAPVGTQLAGHPTARA